MNKSFIWLCVVLPGYWVLPKRQFCSITPEDVECTASPGGADDGGFWVEREHGIGLGHRSLSIIDLSPAGHQPMHSTSKRYFIAFNGEIYNHLGLRAKEVSKNNLPILLALLSVFCVAAKVT